jgi:hypothetical protein
VRDRPACLVRHARPPSPISPSGRGHLNARAGRLRWENGRGEPGVNLPGRISGRRGTRRARTAMSTLRAVRPSGRTRLRRAAELGRQAVTASRRRVRIRSHPGGAVGMSLPLLG